MLKEAYGKHSLRDFEIISLRICKRSKEKFELSYIATVEARKMAKIRNQYNQVPHLTQDTTWEVKNTLTSQTRAKRSALSHLVTTRQQ